MSETNRYIWPFRVALGLYVLTAVGLVVGAIAVSTRDVPVSAYLQTAPVMRIGQTNAARGIVLDGETGHYLVGADVSLKKEGEAFARATSEPHGHVHLQFEPTAEHAGVIEVEAQHSRLDEAYVLAAEAVVVDPEPPRWPEPTRRSADPWDPPDEPWSGDVTVDLFPETDIVRGLPDVVVLRLTDTETGVPVAGSLTVKKVEGMIQGDFARSYTSDALGFVRIELTAMTRQLWTLEARRKGAETDTVSEGKVGVDTAPAQYSLRLSRPYARPGEMVDGVVYSLHRTGGIMVDLYDPDDWVAAYAYGLSNEQSGVRVEIPETDATSLHRVQVYGNIFGVDTAWDADYVAVAPEPGLVGCRLAMERLLDQLAKHDEGWATWRDGAREQLAAIRSPTTCSRTLDSLLLAVPRHYSPPFQLVNSQQAEREELEAWKAEVRGDLVLLLGFVLAGGLLVVAFLVLRGLAENRRQQALFAELDRELEGDGDGSRSRYEEYLDYARIAIILVSLASFVMALLMLLGKL